ncbi:MAG: ATP-binding protein [Thermodesulfobacteria bacterium]|nr:ATP-binding protein [Thermodesulfobacteriota bacterium]
MTSGSNPVAKAFNLSLKTPALGDNRSPEKRLRDALAQKLQGERPLLPLDLARRLPEILPKAGYNVQATVTAGPCGWRLARCLPANESAPVLGMAVDLGSTSVVFYLVDLETGKTLASLSKENPQRQHGEDILDRIIFAQRGGLTTLQSEVINLFNASAKELCSAQGVSPTDIVFMSVAGNTTMCHFLLALDPSHICKEPYIPAVNRFDPLRPDEIGLEINPAATIYVLPNVGSYFGGDLIAGILASRMAEREEISMLVDVGTNAEVVLGNKDWMVACAGAAGPALEGGILSCGMRAQPGAIERVRISPSDLSVEVKTIGDEPPKGLCGSGIIDLLAAMFEAGLVDQTGKLMTDRDPSRMRKIDHEWAYVVVPESETAHGKPIYISQSDIKNLIRSKGAMYTILNVVIQSVGITFDDIDNFFVAGAFGNYIDPAKAITIGMLPEIPLDKFKPLGNSAGMGAVRVLLEKDCMNKMDEICEKITYLEMNVRGDFMNQLTGALFLPHTDLSRFPGVAKRLRLS